MTCDVYIRIGCTEAAQVTKLAYLLSKGLSPSECKKVGFVRQSELIALASSKVMSENLRGEMFSPAKTLESRVEKWF